MAIGFSQKTAFDRLKQHLNLKLILIAAVSVLIALLFPKLTVFVALILIDYFLLNLKIGTSIDLPVDFVFFSIVLLAYYFDIIFAIAFLLYGFIIRIIYGKYRDSHLIKQPVQLGIIFIVYFFRSIDIVTLGTLLYVLRYIITYSIDWLVFRKIDVMMTWIRVMNVLTLFIGLVIVRNVVYFSAILF
jgi:hypothetical protein